MASSWQLGFRSRPMDRLLIAALLVANLGVFLFLCHLVLLVKRTLIHGGRQLELEERAERLQHTLKEVATRLDEAGAEATARLAEREKGLLALARSCERTVQEAHDALAALTKACEPAKAIVADTAPPDEPEAPQASECPGSDAEADDEPVRLDEGPVSPPLVLDEGAEGVKGSFARKNAKVIALQRQGLSKERIAAKLGMAVGEVEVVLGVAERMARPPDRGDA